MLWGRAILGGFLLLLLLQLPLLPTSCPSAAAAPLGPASKQSLPSRLQPLLLPSPGPQQGPTLALHPLPESDLGLPLGRGPEPDRDHDPMLSSEWGSFESSLGSEPSPHSGCQGAICPHPGTQLKPRLGPSSAPERPAEAALLHILSASSPLLSHRLSGVLHLSWGLQPKGSRLTFRLYQPQGCGLCQGWRVICNPYLGAGGTSCIPGNIPVLGAPSWTLARLLLPGLGWVQGSHLVISQVLEGDLHLVHSTLGIQVRGNSLSLNLLKAQTGSHGPGIYYSRAAPDRGNGQQTQTHHLFFQQQGLSWLFALDFVGSRCDRLSVHLYLSPKGMPFLGTRSHRDLEVHFFSSSLSGPHGLISLVWFIPLQHPLLHSQWTFQLRFPGSILRPNRTYTYQDRVPSASHYIPRSVLPFHPDLYAGFMEKADCPTNSLESATLETSLDTYGSKVLTVPLPCMKQPCVIKNVEILGKRRGALPIYRNETHTFHANLSVSCPIPYNTRVEWNIYPITNFDFTPNWNDPVKGSWMDKYMNLSYLIVPPYAIKLGLYMVNYSVVVTTAEKEIKASDYVNLDVRARPLEAVIIGPNNIYFEDYWTLNGSASSDPESETSKELEFKWYCTTNEKHYMNVIIPKATTNTCLPLLPDLRWNPFTSPVLIMPKKLKGNKEYFFRLVIQKGERIAFTDHKITVIAGFPIYLDMPCIENCNYYFVISDRYSVHIVCLNCFGEPLEYRWSFVSAARKELPFDWANLTTTGRNQPYLSVKAYAFKGFPEDRYAFSITVESWSGNNKTVQRSFYLNAPPQGGHCNIHPNKGIALTTKFVVRCSNFRDNHLPLQFKIRASNFWTVANISSLYQSTLGAVMYFGNQSVTPPSFLPTGMPSNQYEVIIYIQVYDSFGASSETTLFATVNSPLDTNSSHTILNHLSYLIRSSTGTLLSTLFQQGNFVQAGYLAYLVASVLNDMEPLPDLQKNIAEIQDQLFTICNRLPLTNLDEVNQVMMTILALTQKGTADVMKAATSKLVEMNQALQKFRQVGQNFSTEQIEIMSSGIATSLSNILKAGTGNIVNETLYVIELLADTVKSLKVPGEKETVIMFPNIKVHIYKVEKKQDVTKVFLAKKDCQNCFYPIMRVSNVTTYEDLDGPISILFYEFKEDPFPWLRKEESPSTEVIGFQMEETKTRTIVRVNPEMVEVYILRKNLKGAVFNLTMGPDKDLLKTTTGFFTFGINGSHNEILIQIVTEVKVTFKVLIYVGSIYGLPIASFSAPYDIPPVANESVLFDPTCQVRVPYLICLSQSLLQATAQGRNSSSWNISVVLQAPYFVMAPNDKLVNISIFTAQCFNMDGIQEGWRKDDCKVGENSNWWRIHCICHMKPIPTKRAKHGKQKNHKSCISYFTGCMIVIPNSINLQLDVIKTIPQNPVTLFTVAFIILTYLVLALWAMHKDETDRFLREHVIILPDNDPYDHICYLVTFYTGSRLGSGTKADVFIQLLGTDASSDIHCLSHPNFVTFYRGSTDTFLLTAKNDLGNIQAIRVWHNNEGRCPSWYLSRVKVENIFSKKIWLFLCRCWLTIDGSLERTFEVTDRKKPISKKDYFSIHSIEVLCNSHLWLSVFSRVVTGPYNRLQRLSCCLAMLLSSMLCNIMFYNQDKEGEEMPLELKHLRGMMRGIESALICEPLQIMISGLFNNSQRLVKPVAANLKALPNHPFTKSDFQNWIERLETWYHHETVYTKTQGHSIPTEKEAQGSNIMLPEAVANAITEMEGKPPIADLQNTEAASPDQNTMDETSIHQARKDESREEQKTSVESQESNKDLEVGRIPQKRPRNRRKKLMLFEIRSRFVFNWWCVYVAWLLIISSSGVASFFIIMYGLTYGYEKSIDWLVASVYSFFQSVFVVQVFKILLMSGIKASTEKYCKSIPWVTRFNYIEIHLKGTNLDADETRELHYEIIRVRGTRMYQPLAKDEIRIFKRRKNIQDRAVMFLRNLVSHLIFLTLLLCLISLTRPPYSFRHNQAVRDQFSLNLTKVNELEDIYGWLTSILLPLIHNNQNPTFMSNSWSKILSLPRMRQVRAKSLQKPCFLSGTLVQKFMEKGNHCHSQYSQDMEDQKNYGRFWTVPRESSVDAMPVSFTYRPKLRKWVYYSYGLSHVYGTGGYPFYFFPDQHQYNSTVRLQELQESQWLDERTQAVILELTTFNSDTSLFCTISVVFEVSPLGIINPSLAVHSFSLLFFHKQSWFMLFLYGAVAVFFVVYLVEEVIIIHQEKKDYIKSVSNLVSCGLKLIFLIFSLLLYVKFRLAKEIIGFYLKNPDDFTPFHAISLVDQVLSIALGFLGFLTILKTLTYTRFFYDVRLAQRAIVAALPAICHMALLVGVYIFVYVAFGYLVFGQHEWHYSSIIHSTQTIFSYCVSAFQDTTFLNKEVLGGLFLSTFMLVMVCVLINLFQAVILSAYEEMKQLVYEEPAEEVEAITYLFHKVRNLCRFLTCRAPVHDQPAYFSDIFYGHPENKSYHYLGLKTRNINGKRMSYVVV